MGLFGNKNLDRPWSELRDLCNQKLVLKAQPCYDFFMKLALVPLEQWETLNDRLKAHFTVPDDNSVRVYKGMAHAVFEVAQGTAQFLSHKRSLGIVKGQTPYFETLLPYFYKEAYAVQAINHRDLADPEAWVHSLKKETSFVLFSEDHPVTAEVYDFDRLDQILNEKKIFSFRISHFRHLYEKENVRPYSVRICYLESDYAIAICGERFRSPSLIAPYMNWNPSKCLEEIAKIHVSPQNQIQVEAMEQAFSPIAMPWFVDSTPRLYDRVLLKFANVSGELMLHRLLERLQVDESQFYKTIDTTNLCRWNHYKTFTGWWEPKPATNDLASLVVIDSGWLITKDFAKVLKSTYEEIQADQSW